MSLDFKLRRTLMGLSYPRASAPAWMSPLEPGCIALFDARCRRTVLGGDRRLESCASADPVDRPLEFFTNFYLQDDILAKTDRAAMMVSLEARAVFLDNDVVDFCRRLPRRFKIRNGESKYLLRRVAETLLPQRHC